MVFANAENNSPLIDALNLKHLNLKLFSFIPFLIFREETEELAVTLFCLLT